MAVVMDALRESQSRVGVVRRGYFESWRWWHLRQALKNREDLNMWRYEWENILVGSNNENNSLKIGNFKNYLGGDSGTSIY